MFYYHIYDNNKLFGMKYTIPKKGNGVAMHEHTDDEYHNVIVMKGSVEIYGPSKNWAAVVNAGEVFDLHESHQPHEIMALEDDTVFLGLNYNGKPSRLENTEIEQEGTVRRPMTFSLVGPLENK